MQKFVDIKSIGLNTFILFIIICLSLAYFWPQLEGKVLSQSDITQYKGMSKEASDFRKSIGEEPLWTNSMFGGMPAYMISTAYPGNITNYFQGYLRRFFHPAAMLFLYILGFYILLRTLSIGKWQSLVGAIAYGFSSYYLIIIGAGHNTKAYAIGYMAIVIAGIIMAFRGRYFIGFLLFTFSFSLQLESNHLQITYYTLIIVVLLGIVEFVYAYKEKCLFIFFKSILILLLGTLLALGMNFSRLFTSWEYSKQTIRGPSELTSNNTNKTTGLDKDYVVQWSYGIDETMNLLIPGYMGNGSQINPGIDSESYRTLQKQTRNARQNIQAVSMYHGDQPSTQGPVYLGAIVVFLFILGLFIVRGRKKWWLLTATIVSIVLSWGGNIMWLTSFLLDYLPLYNKFRAPSMILVIAQFSVPLLGFIALNSILKGEIGKEKFKNALKWTLVGTGGVCLLLAAFPGIAGNFSNPSDAVRLPEWLLDSVIIDRKNMLRADAFRSLIFILLASGALYAWYFKKIKINLFVLVLGVLILVDLWSIDKRFLNNDNFETKRENNNPFPETIADKEILKDKDLSYRVLPLQSNTFMDARASYYHKNVGGYHAAKLRRYQELIDYGIRPEMNKLVQGLQAQKQFGEILANLPVINMLNTRYLIYDLNNPPFRNTFALGNAWFVSDYKIIENADEEILAIRSFDSRVMAIIDKRFEDFVQNKTFLNQKTGNIVLTDYQPNNLKYSFNSTSERLTVFSEIYYDKGWNAYVDGVKVPHFRVNYILRALVIPEGSHQIEFKFEPKSYFFGTKISYISSTLLLLVMLIYIIIEFRKGKNMKKLFGRG